MGVHVEKWRGEEKRRLTVREKQVVNLVVEGRSNRQVGQLLDISEETVKLHLYRAYNKLGIDTRHQLLALLTGKDFRIRELRLEWIRVTHRLSAIEEQLAFLGEDHEGKKPAFDIDSRAGDVAGVRTN
jgi:DNA-binding CsgD family transcriptional regulator